MCKLEVTLILLFFAMLILRVYIGAVQTALYILLMYNEYALPTDVETT